MKRLAILTMAELLKFAGKVKEQRKATAEKLFTDRVMTREELIKHGLLGFFIFYGLVSDIYAAEKSGGRLFSGPCLAAAANRQISICRAPGRRWHGCPS
jgi:hypothetical protein